MIIPEQLIADLEIPLKKRFGHALHPTFLTFD
jgi:hypothetical protein